MDIENFFSWWFRNRVTGKITLVEFPNAPLWTFFAGTAVQAVSHLPDTAATVISLVSTAALALWAVLEVGWGVNPFRRVLGAAILLVGFAMHLR